MEPAYVYRATCTRVIDGDTFVADVDLGFRVHIEVRIRIRGVDTPERGEDGWAEARDFLERFLGDDRLLIRSYRDQRSFERWVADVWTWLLPEPDTGLVGEWALVADSIVQSGHGRVSATLPGDVDASRG